MPDSGGVQGAPQGNRIWIFVEVKTYRYLKCAGSNMPCNRARLQSCRKLPSELEGFSPCKRPFQARTYLRGHTATPEGCSTKGFLQGLKANLFNDLIGTTEVVPCYKAFSRGSGIGISYFGLLFKCDCPAVPHPFRVFCEKGGKAQTSPRPLQPPLAHNPTGKLRRWSATAQTQKGPPGGEGLFAA
jgi:hypothetical protein